MSETRATGPSVRTLKELADALGVSRTTVSNAFNRPDQLSEDLRERILGAARDYGYPGPNPMARKLRTGRAHAVGVLLGDSLPYAFTDAATIAFLRGIAQVCQDNHCGVLILPVLEEPGEDRMISEAAVDGFITYCLPKGSPVIPHVLERRLPVVTVEQTRIPGAGTIDIDDRGGAYRAARHLLELGHRRLVILSLDLKPDGRQGPVTAQRRRAAVYASSTNRLTGYDAALHESGIDPAAVPVLECPGNNRDLARRLTLELLRSDRPPTAVLAMSDELALGAMQAAADLGVAVPDRLSVVGFDDTPAAERSQPALTTVRQPLTEKGCLAARLLLPPNAAAFVPEHRRLHTELVIRESTAPPSSGPGGTVAQPAMPAS